MNIYSKLFSICLLIAFAKPSAAVEKLEDFKPNLTNCAVFFGILSQAKTDNAPRFKSMAFLFSSYSTTVIPPSDIDKELAESRKNIGELLKNSRDGNNQEVISNQFSTCMDTLKKAEEVLWPKLSEINKSLTPKIFE